MATVATPRSLKLELPCLPPVEYSANQSRGAAWQRQWRIAHDARRGAVDEIVALVREQGWQGPPMDLAEIRVTFYLPDRRKRDGLGLLERLKPWIDGLVTSGIIQDDDLNTIGFLSHAWEYRPRQPGTVIMVSEVAPIPAPASPGDGNDTEVGFIGVYHAGSKLGESKGGRPRLNISMESIVRALRHEGNNAAAAWALGCSATYIAKRLKEANDEGGT